MMSIGALRMPEMAETVPESARKRAFWVPKAPKYSIMAIPPFRKERLCARDTGSPVFRTSVETRGSQTSSRKAVGSSIN